MGRKKGGKNKVKKTTLGLKDTVDNGTTVVTIPTPKGWKCERENCHNDVFHTHGTYPTLEKKPDTQKEIVETIKEIIKYVPEPRLEGFALYKALKDKGYFQGGQGFNMEDPNGTESVYVPHPQEVIGYFIGDPSMWDKMRDGIIRTYLELI